MVTASKMTQAYELKEPVHYRFYDLLDGERTSIVCDKFYVIAETPKGFWVVPEGCTSSYWQEKNKRWVSKGSRKRFCYPNIKQAFESYNMRNLSRLQILQNRLDAVKVARQHIKTILDTGFDLNQFVEKEPKGFGLNKYYPSSFEPLQPGIKLELE